MQVPWITFCTYHSCQLLPYNTSNCHNSLFFLSFLTTHHPFHSFIIRPEKLTLAYPNVRPSLPTLIYSSTTYVYALPYHTPFIIVSSLLNSVFLLRLPSIPLPAPVAISPQHGRRPKPPSISFFPPRDQNTGMNSTHSPREKAHTAVGKRHRPFTPPVREASSVTVSLAFA